MPSPHGEFWSLSTRARTALSRAGVTTRAQMLMRHPSTYLKVKGCGWRTYEELLAAGRIWTADKSLRVVHARWYTD